MATFITEQSKIHTLVIRIYIDLHLSIIHQIFICRNCKFGTILVHVYSKNMNDVILKRALYCQSRLCMSLYLIHTCLCSKSTFRLCVCSSNCLVYIIDAFFTYLFCWAFTRAAEMFWSMKNKSDRQNPSPIAPNTAPTDRLWKGTTLKTSNDNSRGVKLLSTATK